MLHWSPDPEVHAIIARKISFDSSSVRVEIENASAHSVQSEPANMESTAFRTSESAVLRAPFSGGAAGLRDREPSTAKALNSGTIIFSVPEIRFLQIGKYIAAMEPVMLAEKS